MMSNYKPMSSKYKSMKISYGLPILNPQIIDNINFNKNISNFIKEMGSII
jgi:hypothetical protein